MLLFLFFLLVGWLFGFKTELTLYGSNVLSGHFFHINHRKMRDNIHCDGQSIDNYLITYHRMILLGKDPQDRVQP